MEELLKNHSCKDIIRKLFPFSSNVSAVKKSIKIVEVDKQLRRKMNITKRKRIV